MAITGQDGGQIVRKLAISYECNKMNRRKVLQSFMAIPAASAAVPAMAAQAATADDFPKLAVASVEAGAAGLPGFFTAPQLEALRKLEDAIVPSGATRPAASQAGVAEFLDFLVGQSPQPVQDLYRQGLDRLARDGVNERTLAPLKEAWTYAGPAGPFAQFLHRAKADIVQATINSREWADSLGRGRRGSAPTGYFWRSLD